MTSRAALLNMDSLSLDGTEATEEEVADSDPGDWSVKGCCLKLSLPPRTGCTRCRQVADDQIQSCESRCACLRCRTVDSHSAGLTKNNEGEESEES
eukprot:765988-Hanusia_phi.AAC.21